MITFSTMKDEKILRIISLSWIMSDVRLNPPFKYKVDESIKHRNMSN